MSDKISVLVAARKNSKYLGKFLAGYFNRTDDLNNTEILVMLNQGDTWNNDLVEQYDIHDHLDRDRYVKFYREDLGLGRAGLHQYFNELVKYATGDWIIYFCEDHYIVMPGWDNYIRKMISGELTVKTEVGQVKRHNHGRLDPNQVWCIVPSFDNAGPMNHMVSKGYIKAQGGYIARHGNLDSYINDVAGRTRTRILLFDTDPPMFHDFTHDIPNPMSDAAMQSVISPEGKKLPKYESQVISDWIDEDVKRLHDAIDGGL